MDQTGYVPDPDSPAPAGSIAPGGETRYLRTEAGDGPRVYCLNSPNIALSFDRGRTVSGPIRRGMPRGTIFLDGAFAGPPFYDNKRRHYSLDHHAGCVRSFTLATCEQAAVVIFQGMPLSDGSWTIHVNSIDADSLLAAWLLMNHAELLRDNGRLLEACMPLVRLEGAIDAHGIEAGMLSGIEAGVRAGLEGNLATISRECAAMARLGEGEAIHGIIRLLTMLDSRLLPDESVEELLAFEEVGRAGIRGGGIAMVVRTKTGIYEAEAFFKSRLGKSLDLLVLNQSEGVYSVRLVNRFLRDDLSRLFSYLNKRDKAVLQSEDRTGNAWGGAANIGGSPRLTGSSLSPREVLEAIERVYGPRSTFLGRTKLFWTRLRGGKPA